MKRAQKAARPAAAVPSLLAPSAIRKARLAPPPCTIGITDGSERGDYVAQSHLLDAIGRPHHVVNLMFQYYPDMADWPTQGVKWRGFFRNGQLNKGDGYFPLVLEEGGTWGQLYLRQIEDVRSHGQEPQLTLTIHCDTPDETLVRIAKSLAPYGRMRIRINHECNGIWFYFNQRWSYAQVSDFFIRFHNILHEHAPLVQTVACWNGRGEDYNKPKGFVSNWGKLTEDQLAPMFRVADIVSYDQYASLHYGWPDPNFDPKKPSQFFKVPFDSWWTLLDEAYADLCEARGGPIDFEVHEINEDAELVGDAAQARWTTKFYKEVVRRKLPWLRNITFYMFRDRGGLGLEREDVDDPAKFKAVPALAAYRDAIDHPWFAMKAETAERKLEARDLAMKWISPTDAEGREFEFKLPSAARRFSLSLPKASALLVGHGDRWIVKEPGVERVKLERAAGPKPVRVKIFALPADGKDNFAGAYVESFSTAPVVRVG